MVFLKPILNVAQNAFTEAVRQPIYVVVLLGTMLLLAVNPALSAFTLDDDDKLLLDLGLSTIFLAGLLLSAFCATGVFNREIENKTVLTVVSKPIARPTFVLGKYLGVTAAIGLAFWIWSLVFLLTVRHKVQTTSADLADGPVWVFGLLAFGCALAVAVGGNFLYRWVFASTLAYLLAPLLTASYLLVLMVNKEWALQPLHVDFRPQVLIALLLVLEAMAIICAVAVACSTRLGQIMTLSLCTAIFAVGLTSDYLFGRFADTHTWAAVAYTLVPNLQYLWLADALTQGHPVDAGYIGMVSGYSALYVVALLGLATALFQTREVG